MGWDIKIAALLSKQEKNKIKEMLIKRSVLHSGELDRRTRSLTTSLPGL